MKRRRPESQTKTSQGHSTNEPTLHDRTPTSPDFSLAKLAAPTLPTLVERTHLFEHIDHVRQRGAKVLWIQGPPGAGKTTLAASYLRARKLPALWYQLDTGDADPASWFHYLTLGIQKAAPRFRQSMVAFEPAYLSDLSGFTRRYFEQLFIRLKSPNVLIFDNYHDLPDKSPLDTLMLEAFRTVPPGRLCVVTSRQAPPPSFATLLADQMLGEFPGDQLFFSLQETHDLLGLHHLGHEKTSVRVWAQHLHDTTKGWVAGIILLGTKQRPLNVTPTVASTTPPITTNVSADDPILLDYFAQEGLARLPHEVRILLLKTAMLPAFTVAMAQKLTGMTGVGYELKKLVRARYFVENRAGSQTVFQYHPLFKQFLNQQATEEFGRETWQSLQAQAADLLIAEGWIEAAIHILFEAGHLHVVSPLLIKIAPDLMEHGRFQRLAGWLDLLPPEEYEKEPYLVYWRGMSHLLHDPTKSLNVFQNAFDAFQTRNDVEGMLLAASGMIQAIEHTWTDFDRLDRWLTEIDSLWEEHGSSMSSDVQASVTIAMVHGLFWRLPRQELMQRWIDRTEAFLPQFDRLNELPLITLYILFCSRWFGLMPQGMGMMAFATQRLEHAVLLPSTQFLWATTQVVAHGMTGDFQKAKQLVRRGLELSEQHGFTIYTGFLVNIGLASAMNNQDLELGEILVAKGWQQVDHMGPVFQAAFSSYNAWLHGLKNEWEKAATFAKQAPPLARKTKGAYAEAFMAFGVALIAVASGRFQEAQESLQEAETLATTMGTTTLQFSCYLLRAYEALKTGSRNQAIHCLKQGLSLGAQHSILYTTEPCLPDVLTPCCAFALEEGIEPEFARQLIRVKRLTLDSASTEMIDWPWPIRIQTLSQFLITIDGRPLTFHHKVPLMPMRLLKLLISLGGRDIPLVQLSDLLWPKADGDSAYRSLLSALSRLRKLLGREDALIVQGGRLSLNHYQCWVDSLTFIYLGQAAIQALNDGQPDRAKKLAVLADRVYQGPFLKVDDALPQIEVQRKRLAGQRQELKETFGI